MSIAAISVEVLNASYVPVGPTKLRRALALVRDNKAVIEEFHEDGRKVRTVEGFVLIPKIIRLLKMLKIRVEYSERAFSREGVLTRDDHTCGYCLGKATTYDHILPRSRGGTDSWRNCISACLICNGLKGSRTPEEADMPLLFKPTVPFGTFFRSDKAKRPRKKKSL